MPFPSSQSFLGTELACGWSDLAFFFFLASLYSSRELRSNLAIHHTFGVNS